MRVSVFGLGYVGAVTSACLAQAGHEVTGVDVNHEKVAMVNAGASPIVEPGLGDLLTGVVAAGRLRATSSGEKAVADTDLALICRRGADPGPRPGCRAPFRRDGARGRQSGVHA